MAVWKSIGGIYLLTWIFQWILFWLVKRHTSGYFRAHVLRFEHIVKLELVMIIGSFFIWKRISGLLLEIPGSKLKANIDDESPSFPRKSSRQPPISPRLRLVRPAFLTLMIIFLFCCHISHFFNYFASTVEPRLFSWLCLASFGLWVHLVSFMVGFSIVNFLVRYISSKEFGGAILQPIFSRSHFIQQLSINVKWQTVASVVLSVVFTVFLLLSAGHLSVKRAEIVLPKLPKSMDGFKIVLLTDMHAGPTVGRKAFARTVEMTNELNPDVVTIVGDLVDGPVDDLKEVVEPIGKLKTKYGVYFSTGNHEMYYGKVDDWIAYLRTLNVKVLRNEHVKISPAQNNGKKLDTHLCLAGADDIYAETAGIEGHGMDLKAAVNGCSPESITVLMAHNPKAAKKALELEKRIDLILCGHTHAGQMYVLAPIMYITMPFFHGLYQYSKTGTFIYVSAGVFYWGAPMKMFSMSEIILITLKAST